MKNRKQKQSQPKKVILHSEEHTHTNIINPGCKQISGHTKISTNCTIHSTTATHTGIDRKQKNKKNGISSSKQNMQESIRGLPTSKSTKKFKILELPLHKQAHCQIECQQSYRQYCVVDENFVPITNKNQQKLLDHFLAQTAASSCDYNYFKNVEKTVHQDNTRSQLRKRSISNDKSMQFQKVIKIQKEDKAISNIDKKKSFRTIQVSASPECFEIGMQYSERKSLIQQKKETKVVEEIQEEIQQTQSETLSDLLLKLQFSHLGDDKQFTALSSNQKQHFSQLLQTMITKLKPKAQNILKPISFSSIFEDGIKQDYKEQQNNKTKESIFQNIDPNLLNYQKLESQICLREYTQMNWVEDPNNYDGDGKVNTSLFSIINFLCHLFCYIEVQYSEQFVCLIKKMYGLTFRQKYKRITRKIPICSDNKFKVVDESVFLDFINQNVRNQSSQNDGIYNTNQIIHFKAVFDGFNEHLEEYRPFYMGNGQQFPWALKMFVTMSEYSIDEESLQIIFRQAKDKMIEWASHLCGIIVQHQEKVMLPNNPLQIKKIEKENRFILGWINEENFEKDGIELYSTQILHEVSDIIFKELVCELVMEKWQLYI